MHAQTPTAKNPLEQLSDEIDGITRAFPTRSDVWMGGQRSPWDLSLPINVLSAVGGGDDRI